jgi:hypothetical protein
MADYPTNDPSDGSLLIAANNVASTLNGGMSGGATAMTLASTVHFPLKGGVTVESEAILYTNNDTATSVLSGLTRGADSTTAAIHADGTAVYMNMQARHHNALKDEVIAVATDMRNVIKQDLDDTQGLSTTAATMKMRVDQIARTIRDIKGGATTTADWKDDPRAPISTLFTGRILQMTQTTNGTFSANSTTSYTTTGLQATISPMTTTSKILIMVSQSFGVEGPGTCKSSIDRDGNIVNEVVSVYANNTSTLVHSRVSMNYMETPGTTGSITYRTSFRGRTAVVTYVNGDASATDTAVMILMEISQ